MSTVSIIAGNELKRLFVTPFAWVVLATLQFLLAIFFFILVSKYMQAEAQLAARGITQIVVIGLLQIAAVMILVLSPFMTMRCFSEELRSGTIRLVLSSPVSITQLVLGKYAGLMVFHLAAAGLVLLLPLSLVPGTRLDFGLMFSAFTGLCLLLSSFAAIGMFASSMSRSPALAAVGSFGCLFLLWIVHVAADSGSERLGSIVTYLSMQKHFNSLLSGAFSSVDLVYFLLVDMVFIALCIWRLDAIRTHQ